MMDQCRECGGFLPPSMEGCPNCSTAVMCSVPPPGWSRRLVNALMATAGGGVLMTTLMACYGAPVQECEPADDDQNANCVTDSEEQTCVSSCEQRADYLSDVCDLGSRRGCVSACQEIEGRFSREVDNAVYHCLESSPLCDMNLGECVMTFLYPAPITLPTTLKGSGFDALDGLEVEAFWGVDKTLKTWSSVSKRAEIIEGEFELSWAGDSVQTGDVLTPPTIAVFLDLDQDGDCDPSVDLIGSAESSAGGDYIAPTYQLELTPSGLNTSDSETLCDSVKP